METSVASSTLKRPETPVEILNPAKRRKTASLPPQTVSDGHEFRSLGVQAGMADDEEKLHLRRQIEVLHKSIVAIAEIKDAKSRDKKLFDFAHKSRQILEAADPQPQQANDPSTASISGSNTPVMWNMGESRPDYLLTMTAVAVIKVRGQPKHVFPVVCAKELPKNLPHPDLALQTAIKAQARARVSRTKSEYFKDISQNKNVAYMMVAQHAGEDQPFKAIMSAADLEEWAYATYSVFPEPESPASSFFRLHIYVYYSTDKATVKPFVEREHDVIFDKKVAQETVASTASSTPPKDEHTIPEIKITEHDP